MKENICSKYAKLLVNYCLHLKPGEQVFVASTYLAEPLLAEFQQEALKAGAHPSFFLSFREQEKYFYDHASGEQLNYVSPFKKHAMEQFDAYLYIMAPFNLRETQNVDADKRRQFQEANKIVSKIYNERTAAGSLKRSLCQFPTQANAQEAGMSLSEYEDFVFGACYLFEDDPVSKWLEVHDFQQDIVDFLNQREQYRYVGNDFEISFSTRGRKWINSDGKNNMPSGEVFTSPVEDSVNGTIHFTYPAIYMGREVEDVVLEVKNGEVVKWNAKSGKDFLDEIFQVPGAKYFGEAAIGTNKGIQKLTKNILFDEKIGGTIHMAIGQSYLHAGGKNDSAVHWDMITEMRNGGKIYADDELIYENGEFLSVVV